MRCKLLAFIAVLLLMPQWTADAATTSLDDRRVLVMYYGNNERTQGNGIFLEATMTALFEHVTLKSFEETTTEDIEQADVLVVYSIENIPLQADVSQAIGRFQKELLVIGPSATQLPQYRDWLFDGEVEVRSVEDAHLSYSMYVPYVKEANGAEVLASGYHFGKEYPLILKQRNISFSGITQFFENEKYVFTASLYDVFNLRKPDTHYAYIRLEDVSPAADPKLVQQAADYLLNRDIPVYIALIPVYLDPATGKEITIKDVPELRAVLDDLVERGAMIISHGYTHTYRDDETGEGFEFWDSLYNQPITTVDWRDEPTVLKQRQDFANDAQHAQYLAPFKEIERQYVAQKIESAIHMLMNLNMPPIAFEAPHYTMSANGYAVTSEYFNYIFGQVQTSDRDWHQMLAPLLVSQPAILNGMTLLPETIGFVDETVPNPMKEIAESIESVTQVPGAMLGGFYHPYLGIEKLEEMVALLEAVPTMEWLDLRQEGAIVQAPLIKVEAKDGQLVVENDLDWLYAVRYYWQTNPGEFMLWGIVAITAIFVLLFLLHIVTMRFYYRKRLFEERM